MVSAMPQRTQVDSQQDNIILKPTISKFLDQIAKNNYVHAKRRIKRSKLAASEKKHRENRLLRDSISMDKPQEQNEEGLSLFDQYTIDEYSDCKIKSHGTQKVLKPYNQQTLMQSTQLNQTNSNQQSNQISRFSREFLDFVFEEVDEHGNIIQQDNKPKENTEYLKMVKQVSKKRHFDTQMNRQRADALNFFLQRQNQMVDNNSYKIQNKLKQQNLYEQIEQSLLGIDKQFVQKIQLQNSYLKIIIPFSLQPSLKLGNEISNQQLSYNFEQQIRMRVDELERDFRQTFRAIHYFDIYKEEHMTLREIQDRINSLIAFFAKHAKLKNQNQSNQDIKKRGSSQFGFGFGLKQRQKVDKNVMSDSDDSKTELLDMQSTMDDQSAKSLSLYSKLEKKFEFKTAQDYRYQLDQEKKRIQTIQEKFKKNFNTINFVEDNENDKSIGSDTHRGFTKEDNQFENEGKITLAVQRLNQEIQRQEASVSRQIQRQHTRQYQFKRESNKTGFQQQPEINQKQISTITPIMEKKQNDEEERLQQKLTGENALLNALHKYQVSQKVAQISEIDKDKILNPLDKYYKVIDDKQIYPYSYGLVNRKNQIDTVDCSNQIINEDYAEALAQGLSVSKFVTQINMSSCGLTSKSAIMLISLMNRKLVKTLNISSNQRIGVDFYAELIKLLEDPTTNLENLSLESNNIDDNALEIICDALLENKSLTSINLGNNLIKDAGIGVYSKYHPQVTLKTFASNGSKNKQIQKKQQLQSTSGMQVEDEGTKLCRVIRKSKNLKQLFLHNNQIKGPGGAELAKSITDNKYLKVLDVSFNQICGGISTHNLDISLEMKRFFAQTWADCFRLNIDLIHVDISNNNLRTFEMEIIGEGLKSNHTILGLHIYGNEAVLDHKGFVDTTSEQARFQNRIFGPQSISRINPIFEESTGVYKGKLKNQINQNINCWICEGYQERQFIFNPTEYLLKQDSPFTSKSHIQKVYLHLEQDGYKADLMLPDNYTAPNFYKTTRMLLPNKKQNFFFSVNGQVVTSNLSERFRTNNGGASNPTKNINNPFFETMQPVVIEDSFCLNLKKINEYNKTDFIAVKTEAYDEQVISQMQTKPRINNYIDTVDDGQRKPWQFKLSAFRTYQQDTQVLLEKCFEFDWSFIKSKVEYLIKDEKDIEQSKKYLKANYKVIRDAYKLTAGQSSEGRDIMSISTNFFSVLMQSCSDFVDSKTLKISDLDLGFIASKAADMQVKSKIVPMKELIRYNFLEVHIRLAQQKYIKSGLYKSYHEAFKSMMQTYIIPQFQGYDSHIWRKNVFWKEENDLSIKRQYRTLQELYKQHSGKFALPSAQKYVSPSEFAEMVVASKVITDHFSFKEIYPIWNLSMITQVDEVYHDKHLNMNFAEFIEAIGRISDKLAIPHLVDDQQLLQERTWDDVINDPDLVHGFSTRPLHYKIESFILQLSRSCIGERFYQNETIPSLNFFRSDDCKNIYANDIEVSGKHNIFIPFSRQ